KSVPSDRRQASRFDSEMVRSEICPEIFLQNALSLLRAVRFLPLSRPTLDLELQRLLSLAPSGAFVAQTSPRKAMCRGRSKCLISPAKDVPGSRVHPVVQKTDQLQLNADCKKGGQLVRQCSD